MIENSGKHYLYRHIRLDSNEVFYVGVGTKNNRVHNSVSHEYSRAYSKSDRSAFWKSIIAKTEYEVEIFFETNDYDFLKQKEIEFIALYGRRNLGLGTLTNLTDGGEGALGVVMSKITKERIGNSLRGKKRTGEVLIKLQKKRKRPNC